MQAPEFWRRRSPASTALLPLAGLWSAGGWARQRLARPARAAVPVVCVGNLVAGGAGKTPVALALGGLVGARANLHYLTRGYGGRLQGPVRVEPARHGVDDVGDEALLLAAAAPTWVAADRAAGAKAAVAGGAGLIVMDDGLQNHDLFQDLRLVVVDREYGFGNGRVMPAGPLREPVARGLRSTHAIILVGDGDPPPGLTGPIPVLLRARLVPDGPADNWTGRRVVAFAGIGRPDKFFRSLAGAGAEAIDRIGFPDHHRFGPRDLADLADRAQRAGAALVTTAKDWVRLPPGWQGRVEIFRVRLDWAGPDDRAAMAGLLGPWLPGDRL